MLKSFLFVSFFVFSIFGKFTLFTTANKVTDEIEQRIIKSQLSMDEQEARVLEGIVVGVVRTARHLFGSIASSGRATGDTIAHVVGGCVKTTGGFVRMIGGFLRGIFPRSDISTKFRVKWLDHILVRKLLRTIGQAGDIFWLMGESLIIMGVATEDLSFVLGQSMENSFRTLEKLMFSLERGANYLFDTSNYNLQIDSIKLSSLRDLRKHNLLQIQLLEKLRQEQISGGKVLGKYDKASNRHKFPQLPITNAEVYRKPSEPSKSTPVNPDDDIHSEYRYFNILHPPLKSTSRSYDSDERVWNDNISSPDYNNKNNDLNDNSKKNQSFSYGISDKEGNHSSFPSPRSDSPPQPSTPSNKDLSINSVAIYFLIWNWILGPFNNITGVPSLAPYLFLTLIITIIFILKLQNIRNTYCKLLLIIVFLLSSCYFLNILDFSQRLRIQKRAEMHSINSYIRQYVRQSTLQSNKSPQFEQSIWLNIVFANLWLVREEGGLGPYFSGAIEVSVNSLLERMRGSTPVSSFNIRRFDLGSVAPVVRAVRMKPRNSTVCSIPKSGDKYHHTGVPRAPPTQYQSGSERSGAGAGEPRACLWMVADIDFVYVSENLDIAVSLRPPDVKSVVPEVTVSLSELSVSGILRVDAEVIPEFPFLGKSLIGFLEMPMLDVSISTLGMNDLAAWPGMQGWVNMTISWILMQYTFPKSLAVDLVPILCPICVAPPPPTPGEVLRDLLHNTTDFVSHVWRSVATTSSSIYGDILDRMTGCKERELNGVVALVKNDTVKHKYSVESNPFKRVFRYLLRDRRIF